MGTRQEEDGELIGQSGYQKMTCCGKRYIFVSECINIHVHISIGVQDTTKNKVQNIMKSTSDATEEPLCKIMSASPHDTTWPNIHCYRDYKHTNILVLSFSKQKPLTSIPVHYIKSSLTHSGTKQEIERQLHVLSFNTILRQSFLAC